MHKGSSPCLRYLCFRLVSLVPSVFLIAVGPIRLWILLKRRHPLAPELIRNRLYFVKLVRKESPMTANQPIRYTYISRCVAQNNTCTIDHIDPVVVYIIGSTWIVLGFVAFADIKHSFSGKSHLLFFHTHLPTHPLTPMHAHSIAHCDCIAPCRVYPQPCRLGRPLVLLAFDFDYQWSTMVYTAREPSPASSTTQHIHAIRSDECSIIDHAHSGIMQSTHSHLYHSGARKGNISCNRWMDTQCDHDTFCV